jgi:high-affinity iron transporter
MEEFFSAVSIGSVAGAGIGFSIGVLFYYLLVALPERRSLRISLVLLGLAAANMCIQATSLLIQADWLPAAQPLWDTSNWIHEGSLPGQLLYALVGYEATPSPIEAGAYVAALATIGLAAFAGSRLRPGDRSEST